MSKVHDEVLAANARYVESFGKKGYVYDVRTGRLVPVPNANEVGRAA